MAAPIIHGFSPAKRAAIIAARDRLVSATPSLVRRAFLHGPVHVGGITLLPTTLGHWLALEELQHPALCPASPGTESGCVRHPEPVEGSPSALHDAHLIYVLAHTPPAVREALAGGPLFRSRCVAAFLDRIDPATFQEVLTAAQGILRLAVSTVISAKSHSDSGDPFAKLPEKTSGNGWILDTVDVFATQYGFTDEYTIDHLPLVRLFALWSAIKVRNKNPLGGPSYVDQDIIAAGQAAEAAEAATINTATLPPGLPGETPAPAGNTADTESVAGARASAPSQPDPTPAPERPV